MAYLLIIIIVALAGITRITLQQRREQKLHVENDFRSSLEKVATTPLARQDDGPRRRWELAGFNERMKARDDRVVVEQPRRRQPSGSDHGPVRWSDERSTPRRQQRPSNRPQRSRGHREADGLRGRSEFMRQHRADRRRADQDVDWFEDLRSQPSEIRLDVDPAPARLPARPRRTGQPSTRGRLQTQVHANIHPAHLPPSADVDHDLRPARAYSRQRAV